MSVIVEFTVPDEEFLLGCVLAAPPTMDIELERVVPTGDSVIPYLWVRGDDYEAFERRVRNHEAVESFELLDRPDNWILYRMDWADEPFSLLAVIEKSNSAILEGQGNDNWSFRVRCPNHDALSTFYNLCTEQDISLYIERSYTLTEKTTFGNEFGLTQQQREALVLALHEGYFDTPRQTSLRALGEELGISEQAVSKRVRRGNKKVLDEALLTSASSFA